MSSGDKRAGGDCVFCQLPAAGEFRYRDNLIVSCGERAFVILNRFPYNTGHLMVVPRAHVDDPAELGERDYRILAELLRRATRSLRDTLAPDGINLGMNLGRTAGAGIADHCHYHLVPRWAGDTNFMPVVGQTKVLSISLDDIYEQLEPAMGALARQVEEAVP